MKRLKFPKDVGKVFYSRKAIQKREGQTADKTEAQKIPQFSDRLMPTSQEIITQSIYHHIGCMG